MLTPKEYAREAAFLANQMDGLNPSGGHRWVPLWDVKKGEYVRLVAGGPVWVRGEYDRADKRFYLDSFYDLGRMTKRKGSALVLVDFTF